MIVHWSIILLNFSFDQLRYLKWIHWIELLLYFHFLQLMIVSLPFFHLSFETVKKKYLVLVDIKPKLNWSCPVWFLHLNLWKLSCVLVIYQWCYLFVYYLKSRTSSIIISLKNSRFLHYYFECLKYFLIKPMNFLHFIQLSFAIYQFFVCLQPIYLDYWIINLWYAMEHSDLVQTGAK